MVVGLTLEVWGVVLFAAIAVAAIAWYLIARFAGGTRVGRHARHFLDVGDAELPPEESVKNRHPGAGGNG